MPSMMSWSSSAVAVMPSRAGRDVSRVLAVSLMRNDVLVATMTSFMLPENSVAQRSSNAVQRYPLTEHSNQGNIVGSRECVEFSGWVTGYRVSVARAGSGCGDPVGSHASAERGWGTRGDHV